jgi:UDP-N-acetylmuramyl pentapeptide phosphotransferase/UDP-N-acetylglucosamine-1-phosphate transferase
MAAAAGGVLAAVAVVLLLRAGPRLPHAAPNERSLHNRPVPRVGGLALWAGFLPVALLVGPDLPGGLAGWLPPWLALFAVSLVDDARGVPVGLRLGLHVAAALWAAAFLLRMPGLALPGVTPGPG